MSMIIKAPTAKVATYDVANQTDVQFDFEFDPSEFRADGTTLVLEYEGHEIRLENFFDADGATHVENFLTSDGQEFAALDFLSAIMGPEGGETAENLETAAGAAAGGSGAGAYSDDAGNLFDGIDAMGGQGDAYAQTEVERLDEVPGVTVDGDTPTPIPTGIWWWMDTESGGTYSELRQYKGSDESDPVEDYANLVGQTRYYEEHIGTSGTDTLTLTDDDRLTVDMTPDGFVPTGASGDALLLEDDLSFPDDPGHARVAGYEVIHAGAGNDIVDLSSETIEYGDVLVDGGDGNDILWTNSGDDTVYGGNGNDQIIGGLGDDALYGGAGNDTIKGLEDADLLNGGDGSDKLYGGSGNDTINAGTGEHDVVVLGVGQDTLVVDSDSLSAGSHANPFSPDGSTVEVLDFGGNDILDFGSLTVAGYRETDIAGGATTDLQIYITDGASHDTWVVLTDTQLGDLDPTLAAFINSTGIV